ncbi:MAG: hypothetical protein WBW85_10295 [Terriglobales bacterium]
MSESGETIWYVSNGYNAEAACEHCGGVVRHESWCITLDPVVYYAYQIVADPSKLTVGDALILHSLGVIWGSNTCRGKCSANKTESAPSVHSLPTSDASEN